MAKICRMCGMRNNDATDFCADCGSSLLEEEKEFSTTKPGLEGKAKTRLGMPTADSDNPQTKPPMAKPSNPPFATPSKPPASTPSKRPMANSARTVFGMPAPGSVELETKPSKPPMAVVTQTVRTIHQVAPKEPRTVLGIETRKEPERGPEPKGSEEERSWKKSPTGKKTPLYLPRERGTPKTPEKKSEHDDWPQKETKKSGLGLGLVIGIVASSAILAICAVIFAYLVVFKGDSILIPQVFSTADGKAVNAVFAFPDAPPGSSIQVAGKTVPITQGQANLEIRLSELHLGNNDLNAVYAEPGKQPENKSFSIVLRHRVTTDLSGLAASDPFLVVDFKIAAGIALSVEGKQVRLTEGSYLHRIELDRLAESTRVSGDNLIHRVSFQLTDRDGAIERGEHVIAVPVTKLQIDRPADKAIIDTDFTTCAGTTEEGAEVTVEKNPVGVSVAGFLTIVPIPSLGEHEIRVTARAPGKAPNTQTVSVTRLESLTSAVEDWSKDLDRRLDYPTVGRAPNAYANKKIKLSGTIANIKTEKGVTAMLLYIADSCPKGNLCAVYVVFRGETDAGLHSWVDVYGQVKGTRTIDLQSGKRDVPYVEAQFAIKSERTSK